MKLKGRVTKKLFGEGSKSEHEAIMLVTKEGEYVLRRRSGNPFSDPELEALVGKSITCEGDVTDYLVLMDKWTEA